MTSERDLIITLLDDPRANQTFVIDKPWAHVAACHIE